MRYICIACSAGGASFDKIGLPLSFNCHVCESESTMFPIETAKAIIQFKNQITDLNERIQKQSKLINQLRIENKNLYLESRNAK